MAVRRRRLHPPRPRPRPLNETPQRRGHTERRPPQRRPSQRGSTYPNPQQTKRSHSRRATPQQTPIRRPPHHAANHLPQSANPKAQSLTPMPAANTTSPNDTPRQRNRTSAKLRSNAATRCHSTHTATDACLSATAPHPDRIIYKEPVNPSNAQPSIAPRKPHLVSYSQLNNSPAEASALFKSPAVTTLPQPTRPHHPKPTCQPQFPTPAGVTYKVPLTQTQVLTRHSPSQTAPRQ